MNNSRLEYKVLKYSTHSQTEEGLNQLIAEGWQFVSYSAAGDSNFISHFLVVSREAGRPARRVGFGSG